MHRQCPQCQRRWLAVEGTTAAEGWCPECKVRLPEPEPEPPPAPHPVITLLRAATSRDEISRACQELRTRLIAEPDDAGTRYCEAALALPVLPELWDAMRLLGGAVPEAPALARITEDERQRYVVAFLLGNDSESERVHPQAVLCEVDRVIAWCEERGGREGGPPSQPAARTTKRPERGKSGGPSPLMPMS